MEPAQTSFFSANIGLLGRLLRGAAGIALIIFAWTVFRADWHWSTYTILLAGGLFLLFEAFKGWCIMRACRIKTLL